MTTNFNPVLKSRILTSTRTDQSVIIIIW